VAQFLPPARSVDDRSHVLLRSAAKQRREEALRRRRSRFLARVLSFQNIRTFPGQFGPGSWTGLAPDDSLLFVRDISSQEIYSLDLQLP
jgi:hypothetical protein